MNQSSKNNTQIEASWAPDSAPASASEKLSAGCDATTAQGYNRRSFLRLVGGATVASVAIPAVWNAPLAYGAPSANSAAESVVGQLFMSLTDDQKKQIVFPFDHELRRRINANWHITKPTIGSTFYTKEQQQLVDQIVRKVSSPDGYERFIKQMEFDDGGLNAYSMAIFGTPGSGKFEWELTGRHLTLRADGNSVDKAAFGGPIVYGHGEETAKENLFYYQTQQVNEVFKSLSAEQAKAASLPMAPAEAAVPLQGGEGKFPGIAVSALSADQKALVEKTLKTLLAPYRQEDVEEVFEILKATGGLDKLHFAFYQQGDLDNDKLWDIWRVEGPSLVWHFRGAPHVHAYINIGMKS